MKAKTLMTRIAFAGALFAAMTTLGHAQQYPQTIDATQAQTQSGQHQPMVQADAQEKKVFGATYTPVGQVAQDQVQIVYYRAQLPASQGKPTAANVYLDEHFQTALLPNAYTVFCVKPGQHTLGAYLNDAPEYKGKTINRFAANLKAGSTYFLKVQEDGNGAPQALPRDQAEQELRGARAQVHALSRADTVVACQVSQPPAPAAATQYKDYTLKGDLLFAFGKSGYRDISPAGREEIGNLVAQMRRENTATKKIIVVGHADQIGSDEAALKLGMQRAQTVRRMLVERGIPASRIDAKSAGNTEPVVDDCTGSRQQVIQCYAPNRRVMVRADMSSPA
nr:OmpA family protein [uncultured Ralstonia sp.]